MANLTPTVAPQQKEPIRDAEWAEKCDKLGISYRDVDNPQAEFDFEYTRGYHIVTQMYLNWIGQYCMICLRRLKDEDRHQLFTPTDLIQGKNFNTRIIQHCNQPHCVRSANMSMQICWAVGGYATLSDKSPYLDKEISAQPTGGEMYNDCKICYFHLHHEEICASVYRPNGSRFLVRFPKLIVDNADLIMQWGYEGLRPVFDQDYPKEMAAHLIALYESNRPVATLRKQITGYGIFLKEMNTTLKSIIPNISKRMAHINDLWHKFNKDGNSGVESP